MIGPFNSTDNAAAVSPINRLRGELHVPGDKSISHRAVMIGALADGESVLKNFSSAQDCEATINCLESLGVGIVRDGYNVRVRGVGPAGLREPKQTLNAQNSGTTVRLLAGILAGQTFTTTITGDDSLLTRPMLRVAEPLRLMGAQVELEANGCAPLRVKGRHPLQPINYQLPIASAQLKSAVLLAGLATEGITRLVELEPTRDHTERMLPEFGVPVERAGNVLSIQGEWSYIPASFSSPETFPPQPSSSLPQLRFPARIFSFAMLVLTPPEQPSCPNCVRSAQTLVLRTNGSKVGSLSDHFTCAA